MWELCVSFTCFHAGPLPGMDSLLCVFVACLLMQLHGPFIEWALPAHSSRAPLVTCVTWRQHLAVVFVLCRWHPIGSAGCKIARPWLLNLWHMSTNQCAGVHCTATWRCGAAFSALILGRPARQEHGYSADLVQQCLPVMCVCWEGPVCVCQHASSVLACTSCRCLLWW